MPLLEIVLASEAKPTHQQKRAFASEALQIFAEELGTPRANFRLVLTQVALEDTLEILADEAPPDA